MIPWTSAHQASLSITNTYNLLKLMSIELVMLSNHLFLCHPLLFPPSIFPSIRAYMLDVKMQERLRVQGWGRSQVFIRSRMEKSLWCSYSRASLVTQTVKNLAAMQETWVLPLGWEDPLEKGVATHSSSPAWRIP